MSICYLLWPWRKSWDELNPAEIFRNYVDAVGVMVNTQPSADDEKLLAQSWRLFDNENARRNSIDTRAAAIMSAIGLAATLVTGVGFTVFKDAAIPFAARVIILVGYLVSLAYLVRTMVLLFRVHGDVSRYTPDPSDLPTAATDLQPVVGDPVQAPGGPVVRPLSAYDRRLACRIMNYTINNYKINNTQLDALVVAQRAFRNAILTIVLSGTVAGFIIFLNTMAPPVPPCIIE
jgi:hypothetical protein